MSPSAHLVFNEFKIAASSEWQCMTETWLLARMSSGMGYWRDSAKGYQEVSQDDTLLLFPSAHGSVLASRLCDVTLQVFAIDLQMLSGVLTVNECRALAAFAQGNREKVTLLPRQHAFSLRFAEICRTQRPNELLSRLKLLQLFAELLGEGLRTNSMIESNLADGRTRLRRLICQVPEAELMRCSVLDLAKKLSCSQRHFSRLFREEIGVSLRDKQQKLRLDRARHLLEHSSDKIINIALEAGYQSLSLFNVMFKRRFQMTPSQWRFQARQVKKPRRLQIPTDNSLVSATDPNPENGAGQEDQDGAASRPVPPRLRLQPRPSAPRG
jgi:AraC-like DNA-binding protein